MKIIWLMVALGFWGISGLAEAVEYPIGSPQERNGMEIGATYLQPVVMEPEGVMRAPAESDIHLEADIHALANNPNGFAEGEWLPYLVISYQITKQGGGVPRRGEMMPMVANDGPHYGDNIKLAGPGRYRVRFDIAPPTAAPRVHFGRHSDRLTGVRPWFKPFSIEFEMVYAGVGKKGGY